MNPMKLAQLKPKLSEFRARHPKFFQYFSSVAKMELKEGSVLEVRIKNPEGKETCTNIKLTAEDEQFLKDAFSAM